MALRAYLESIQDYRTIMTSEINMVAKHRTTESNEDIEDTKSEVSSMCIEEEIIMTAIQMEIITRSREIGWNQDGN